MNLDNQARVAYKKSPSSAVYFVVLASYLYYVRFESVLSDDVFDKMMKLILDKGIKHSLLSHLITDDDLRAGSLFRLKASDYPYFIYEEAERLIRGVKSYASLE
jgi:hypothetical protein